MRRRGLSMLGIVNIGLAVGLVITAIWLYGREHETRQVERQIRNMKRAIALERETIRRLEIEWQRLRNPMRLERLARLKLALHVPDPLTVMPQARALDLLPLRPPPALEETAAGGGNEADGLAALAARVAAEKAAQPRKPRGSDGQVAAGPLADAAPRSGGAEAVAAMPAGDDPLARLIRNSTGDER